MGLTALSQRPLQGEVYIQFDSLDSSAKGVAGLNGRFFGGRSLAAHVRPRARPTSEAFLLTLRSSACQFLPEILFKAHLD